MKKKTGSKQFNKLALFLGIVYTIACFACGHPEAILKTSPTAETQPTSEPTPVNTTAAVDTLLVPGRQVGKLRVNTNADDLTTVLGRPDSSDAAMGKAWLTWWGKKKDGDKTELDVYTTYKNDSMTERTVQLIRTTSPYFRTADGIGVLATFDQLKAAFPDLHLTGLYANSRTGEQMSVYEAEGIAFEVHQAKEQERCTAILIFDPARQLFPAYLTYLNANYWRSKDQ